MSRKYEYVRALYYILYFFFSCTFQAFVACCVIADCGPRLKYAWGDALQGTDCPGPDGTPYPR